MFYKKKTTMGIEEMKLYNVQGWTPEINLMRKINELIQEVNKLNKKVKELEERK